MRIIRWIAFIPAGIIAALIAMFPIHWIVMLIASNEENLLNILSSRTVEALIIALATPLLIILVGSWIAPTHRFEAAIALSIMVVLIMGGVYVYSFSGNPLFSGWSSLYFGATPILNLAGIGVALYIASRNWKERQTKERIEY